MATEVIDTTGTLQLAHQWWSGLEVQWQRAFTTAVLHHNFAPAAAPKEEDLLYLFRDAVNIRLAGPGAIYPNLDFKLTNLSGIKALTSLTFLSVTNMELSDLSDLSRLTGLRHLFVQQNGLTSLSGIEPLTDLRELYCQNNQLEELKALAKLTKLETLNASHNDLQNLAGLTERHADEMRQCIVLPNQSLRDRDILKFQHECGIIARTG